MGLDPLYMVGEAYFKAALRSINPIAPIEPLGDVSCNAVPTSHHMIHGGHMGFNDNLT